jgi:catechol 2,3-dioxygenase-like lactoylglutathione lyase family enzyme
MISGITATVFVSNMDRAVDFYSKTLEMKLAGRWGDHYASIDIGRGAAIGLHPEESAKSPKPGTPGSIQLGLAVDRPLEQVIADLKPKGVNFRGPIIDDGAVRLAFFGDPDGNELYLCEVKKWGS